MVRTLGVLVNPVAGVGGPVGLKGSDGADVQSEAVSRGAVALAGDRARAAIAAIAQHAASLRVLTVDGPMGADAVRAAGMTPSIVLSPGFPTSAADTAAAARALRDAGAELILFVGGDGTARDVAAAIGRTVPVLGVPAGVKMYSACFALSPAAAGSVVARWASGESIPLEEREVLDVDEQQIRQGRAEPRLHGFVDVPAVAGRTQARKSATPASERAAVA
ncbi:MAG: NAD(+)/NADH kinase, partial [Leifsonia sp.]